MKITTKRGDKGKTKMGSGRGVSKCDLRIKVAGALDEAVSFLGLAKTKIKDSDVKKTIEAVQKDVFRIIGEISREDKGALKFERPIKEGDIKLLENFGNIFERQMRMPSTFVIPGVNEGSAILHIARTVTRRAECLVVELNKKTKINPSILAYLNRLSDLLFTLAVYEEGKPALLKYE